MEDALSLTVREGNILRFKEWRAVRQGGLAWTCCCRMCLSACCSVRQEFGSSEAAAPLAHVFWQIAELSEQGLEDEEPDTEVDAAELVCRHAADQERKKDEQGGGIEEICHRVAPRIALGEAQVAREQLVCWGGKALRGRSGPRADQLVGAACCIEQSAAVGCIARASLAFICMATEKGETQAYKAEDGQEQGEGA